MQLFINFQAFYRIIYNYAFKDNYDHLNYYDEKYYILLRGQGKECTVLIILILSI